MRRTITKSFLLTTALILTLGSAFLYAALRFKKLNFSTVSPDELLYVLFSPTTGANMTTFQQDILEGIWPLIFALTIMIIPIVLGYFLYIKKDADDDIVGRSVRRSLGSYTFLYALFLFLLSAGYTAQQLQLPGYVLNRFTDTQLYEKYYSNPATAQLSVPEKKRNLIVIYMESMENTVASRENGGASADSKIPELEAIAMNPQNVSFSNTNNLGGIQPVFSTTWTVAGMTSQSAGVPLVPTRDVGDNDFGKLSEFLPGAYSLGDVLADQGYTQQIMMGSEASFAGRNNLYSQHGGYRIFDLLTARKLGRIPEDYKKWWGFEDEKLFTYAKQELSEIAKSDKPFNFQLLTADTHFVDGYMEPTCPTPSAKQYDNVYACSSKQIGEFIAWVQQQPFYENTTIVLSGDHLGMQTEYYESMMAAGYTRTIYNAFINPVTRPIHEKKRTFTSLDMYPSVLSSIGITAKDSRLGLGTDLFSARKTLAEELGLENLNQELSRRSKFYTDTIMNGK